MAAGLPTDKATLDNILGGLALKVHTALADITSLKSQVDGLTDAELQALGYSAGDVANIRSTLTDLNKLAGIYGGTQTQASAYDFRQFTKRLIGFAQ
jgi:hypothetical protein